MLDGHPTSVTRHRGRKLLCVGTALFAASCALLLCTSCTGRSGSSSMTLIAANSTWKYLDDGSDQGTSWRQLAFDDSSWPSGAAPLGNVPDGDRRQITTYVKSGPFGNHIITYYFRRSFTVPDSAAFDTLTLQMRCDDGAIVYLNGTEVARRNMPPGTVNYRTPVPQQDLDQGLTWWEFRVSPGLLAAGTNVIAVELHEYDYTTDSLFDLQLAAGAASNNLTGPSAVH